MAEQKKKLTAKQRMERADKAKVLLDNPTFSDSFETVKQAYINRMVGTKPTNILERDYYHICALVLDDVKNVLTLHIQNGIMDERALQKKAKRHK